MTGPPGSPFIEHEEPLAGLALDEGDKGLGELAVGGALQDGDGVAVDDGEVPGEDEADDLRAVDADLRPGVEVDAETAGDLPRRHVLGDLAGGGGETAGVGADRGEHLPPLFPTVGLEDDLVGHVRGAALAGVRAADPGEVFGAGEVGPGLRARAGRVSSGRPGCR